MSGEAVLVETVEVNQAVLIGAVEAVETVVGALLKIRRGSLGKCGS